MGRGRQKAKQTKVARQLKYFSPNTDYTALQRELAGSGERAPADDVTLDDELEDEDEYLLDDEDDGDDDGYVPQSVRR
jgi:Protein of unknown function (DUF3073)